MKTLEQIAEEVQDYYDGLFEDLGSARYNAAFMAVKIYHAQIVKILEITDNELDQYHEWGAVAREDLLREAVGLDA